ncbi:MAG: GNAT family N-acetyltransferase [Vulcanimicrobiaceae bacterium]
MASLEKLRAANCAEALAYLAHNPYENVLVSWLIESGAIGRSGSDVLLCRDAEGVVRGVGYFGPQLVLHAEADEAVDTFAAFARRVTTPRMIVGPVATIDRFWERARPLFGTPVTVRECQPVYAVDRSELRYTRADAEVGQASLDELDEIVHNAAEMIVGELGNDPRRNGNDFRTRTAGLIRSGWFWRYRVDGRLVFMCHIGSVSALTVQLQGVWSPVEVRGHGYATRGLGAICDRLLDAHKTISLYVNDFNAPAIALYERVGFVQVGAFRTILL